MADPVLHIKDAYFFEIPKFLWKRDFQSKQAVADASSVWVELDDQFQDWEFHRQYEALTNGLKDAQDSAVKAGLGVTLPPADEAQHDWHDWAHHDHANFGKPFDEFLKYKYDAKVAEFTAWKQKEIAAASAGAGPNRAENILDAKGSTYTEYKSKVESHDEYDSFVEKLMLDQEFAGKWETAKLAAADVAKFVEEGPKWSDAKLDKYSEHLSGKILIPQPFGRLRNLHERESGITISKYMVVEVAIALIIAILFSWLARRVISGSAPRGRLWNFLEVFVVFIREQIAEPAMGGGHDEHHDDHGHAHVEPGHHVDASGHAVANAAHDHAHAPPKKHVHAHVSPAKKFTPLLCSIFFFVLGCNLAGMLPWIGSPTAAWGVTFAMAMVTLVTVFVAGMIQFGVIGFFVNQVPTMDMPVYMAVILKPAIFLIEFGGLLIKHAVLSVRLLANMVAGHLVLLAIMALAFGAQAATEYTTPQGVGAGWWIAASAAVIGCTLLSLLELFVAFLQAYVFTLLSALFIGAAIHKH